MKLLLDENLPRKLKRDLPDHLVFTVREMGWAGKENGDLLAAMLSDGFEALVTGDKNIAFQQNFQRYPIPVLILNAFSNDYQTIRLFAPKMEEWIRKGLPTGPFLIEM